MKLPHLQSGFAALAMLAVLPAAGAQSATQLRFCIGASPKTFDPLLVTDEPSETVRYLTGGVLLRLNRQSQQLQAELASSWKLSPDGKSIRFTLRKNLRFSDGVAFSPEDVAYTINRLNDSSLHSPVADAFRVGEGAIATQIVAPDKIVIRFPTVIVGVEKLFDQLAILSAHSPQKEMAVLGPYRMPNQSPTLTFCWSATPITGNTIPPAANCPTLTPFAFRSSKIATSKCCAFSAGISISSIRSTPTTTIN